MPLTPKTPHRRRRRGEVFHARTAGKPRGRRKMAKGQKRGNREVKKPKTAVKKPTAGTVASQYQLPTKPAPPEGTGK